MKATHILETSLYASDLSAAEHFYTAVFGLEVVSRWPGRGMAFRCGGSVLLIFDPARTQIFEGRVPPHGAVGAGHVAFLATEADIPAWREHLHRHGVAIDAEVEWPEGGRSLYVRDPAGNSIELAPATLWGGLGASVRPNLTRT